jgi:hypothetical protein
MPSLQTLALGFSTLHLLFAATAAAQQSTLTLPNIYAEDPEYTTPPVTASLVSANPTATTLAFHCPPRSDCGLFPKHTLTYGPSTWHLDMADPNPDAFTGTQDCKFGSSSAVCVESMGGSEANFPGRTTETYEWEGSATMLVVVTEGLEKLSAVDTKATATAATATATGTVRESGTVETGFQARPSGIASGDLPESTNAAGVNGVERGVMGVAAGVLVAWLI